MDKETRKLINEQQGLIDKLCMAIINMREINGDLHQVRPEYFHRLNQIKNWKSLRFKDKSTFLRFLHHRL